MAGNAKPGEDERAHPDSGGESTVAMESPAIPKDAPLPISDRSPALPSRPGVSGAIRPGVPAPNMKATRMGLGPPVGAAPNRLPAVPSSQRVVVGPPTPRGVAAAKAVVKPPPAAGGAGLPVVGDDEDMEDDGPTMLSDQSHFADPPPPAQPKKSGSGDENEVATVAVPKDVLDRVRANPKAVLEEEERARRQVPSTVDDDDEAYEPTKAVAREDLARKPDTSVVVGTGANGEEATLAVPPGANEAAVHSLSFGTGEHMQAPTQPAAFAPPGAFPNAGAHLGQPPPQQQPGVPHQHWSSGHMATAQPAQATPRVQGGVQSYTGPHMPPGAIPRGQVPTNWTPQQPPVRRSRISGQMILLVVVGIVCLAIFVTGIVLFATTKF